MTRTPIFDELYAKYVACPPAREETAAPVTAPVTEPIAAHYAWAHPAPQWPAEN